MLTNKRIQNEDNSSVNQHHLNHQDKINLGAFYTPLKYVTMVWKMIQPFLNDKSVVLDSSCGYGNFFNYKVKCRKKANDIDPIAISYVKKLFPEVEVYNKNSLLNIHRNMFNISNDDQLIIIGNPPYNDVTSIIRNKIKKKNNIKIDKSIKTRDYGISFLLSYAKLKANVVCILHPLSYLIKKANFNLLKGFTRNYKLIDDIIIDSKNFRETSKGVSFPIIIALYKKDEKGMDYNYIENYKFKTIDKHNFTLKDFDFISRYINKYPSKNNKPQDNDILFWTMRDINALRRNRTFVDKFGYNTIIINRDKLDYYIYVDVFKQFNYLIPYYLGNLDVFINKNLYDNYKKYFLREVVERHHFLKKYIRYNEKISVDEAKKHIFKYFKILLGDHYVYKRN